MPSFTDIERPPPPPIATTCNGVRNAIYLGGYCAAKSPLGMEPLPRMISKDPLRQSMGGILKTFDHAPFSIGSGVAVMVDIV